MVVGLVKANQAFDF